MKVTRRIFFDANKLFSLYYELLLEMAIIIARRLEDEAQTNLYERMKGEKSSGALGESLQGVVSFAPKMVMVQLRSDVKETGQWEDSMGESREANYTANNFNYAYAVEKGTGEFGPRQKAISKKKGMVFWMGGYTSKGTTKKIKTPVSVGQPALGYGEDALRTVSASVLDLLKQVGKNIDADSIWVKR